MTSFYYFRNKNFNKVTFLIITILICPNFGEAYTNLIHRFSVFKLI